MSATESGSRGGLGEHPIAVAVGLLASIVTILGFLLQLDVLSWPQLQGGGGGSPCSNPAISLSHGSGPSGSAVTVTGKGFPNDEKVSLRFHTEELTPARTSSAGEFSVGVRIPGTFDAFAPQQFSITAVTTPTVCSDEASYRLTR